MTMFDACANNENEKLKAAVDDAISYGNGFSKDGKRVDPKDVFIESDTKEPESVEDDLTWLAKHRSSWDWGASPRKYIEVDWVDAEEPYRRICRTDTPCEKVSYFTKDQWLQRRIELGLEPNCPEKPDSSDPYNPEFWNKYAPKGAEYFDPKSKLWLIDGGACGIFAYSKQADDWYVVGQDGGWHIPNLIPRPAEPESVELDDTKVPVINPNDVLPESERIEQPVCEICAEPAIKYKQTLARWQDSTGIDHVAHYDCKMLENKEQPVSTDKEWNDEVSLFSDLMRTEIAANSGKGDFFEWNPDSQHLVSELDHHLNKLKAAIIGCDSQGVTEYSADIANYCMKAHLRFGIGSVQDSEAKQREELIESLAEILVEARETPLTPVGTIRAILAKGESLRYRLVKDGE